MHPGESFDPAAVNDIETARLALRWALEQLHASRGEAERLQRELGETKKDRTTLQAELKKREEAAASWKLNIRHWEREAIELEIRDKLEAELKARLGGEAAEGQLGLRARIQELERALSAAGEDLRRARQDEGGERLKAQHERDQLRLREMHRQELADREGLWERKLRAVEKDWDERAHQLSIRERVLAERFEARTQELLRSIEDRRSELERGAREKEAKARQAFEEERQRDQDILRRAEAELGRERERLEAARLAERAALDAERQAYLEEARRRLEALQAERSGMAESLARLEALVRQREQETASKVAEGEQKASRLWQAKELELLAQFHRGIEAARSELQGELRRTVEDYEARLIRKEAEIAEVRRDDAVQAQTDRENLQRRLENEYRAREEALKERARALDQRTVDLTRREAELENRLRVRQDELAAASRKRDEAAEARLAETLERERASVDRERAALQDEARRQAADIARLRQSKLEDLTRREDELKAARADAEAQWEARSQEVEDKRRRLDDLEKAFADKARSLLRDASEKLGHQKDTQVAEAMVEEKRKLEAQLAGKSAELESFRRKTEEQSQLLGLREAALQREAKELEDRRQALEAQFQQRVAAGVTEAVKTLQQDYDRKVAAVNQEHDARLEKARDEFADKLKTMSAEYGARTEELDKERAELREAMARLAKQPIEARDSGKAEAELKSRLAQVEQERSLMRKEFEKRGTELEESHVSRLSELESRHAQMTQDMQREREELDRRREMLAREVEARRRQLETDYEAKLKDLHGERGELGKEVLALKEKLEFKELELAAERKLWEDRLAQARARTEEARTRSEESSQESLDVKALAFGMAHQIRNPLGVIKSHAQFCLSQKGLSAEGQDALNAIVRNSDKLTRRVEELVGFTKPLQLDLRPSRLSEVASATLARVEERCARGHVRVQPRLDPLPPLSLDPELLSEALLQVLSNAIEAMPQGGRLMVEAQLEGSSQVLRISDTGSGVPAERLKEVFTPFFTTKPGSIGLGLSIARRLILAMGGEMQLESTPEVGTMVRIAFRDKA